MSAEPERAKKPLRVIVDSNALFVPLQFKIDIFEELRKLLNANFELVLLSPIRRELENMAEEGSPKTRKNAAYALKLAERCKLVHVEDRFGTFPDDVIFNVAGEWRCPVFTNDRQLRKKLRNISVPIIYVRQKSRLEIDGRI